MEFQQQQAQAEAEKEAAEGEKGERKHGQAMEKQDAMMQGKSQQEQQRVENQAAVKAMSPATNGAPVA